MLLPKWLVLGFYEPAVEGGRVVYLVEILRQTRFIFELDTALEKPLDELVALASVPGAADPVLGCFQGPRVP